MASDTPDNAAQAVFSQTLAVNSLARQKSGDVNLALNAKELTQLRKQLGLLGLRKVSLRGGISPLDQRDWQLKARLGATIIQECGVTLQPITTRIEESVVRIWRADMSEIVEAGSEEEMPEDTSQEQLGTHIDLGRVLAEALGLALPPYPRAENATLNQTTFAAPGTTPMQDQDTKPFAGLAGLRDSLAGKGENGES